jgi:hypothetical protein
MDPDPGGPKTSGSYGSGSGYGSATLADTLLLFSPLLFSPLLYSNLTADWKRGRRRCFSVQMLIGFRKPYCNHYQFKIK